MWMDESSIQGDGIETTSEVSNRYQIDKDRQI